MKFRVRWAKAALNELAHLWTEADSGVRQRITFAANEVDEALASDPYGHSESRLDGRRIAFFHPLGVIFRVEIDGTTVSVLHVWQFRMRAT